MDKCPRCKTNVCRQDLHDMYCLAYGEPEKPKNTISNIIDLIKFLPMGINIMYRLFMDVIKK